MTVDRLRDHCLALPHVTEHVRWGDHLVFKIGGKMFAIASLEPSDGHVLSVKCDGDAAAELVEREGVVPAPYLARHSWVALERFDALDDREIRALVTRAYEIVRAGLPPRTRAALEATGRGRRSSAARVVPRRERERRS